MTDDPRRTQRVAGQIRSRLGEVLSRETGDADLATTVVTEVEVTKDLSIAHVRVRRLGVNDGPKERDGLIARLKRASPHLRRALGSRLGLRRVPELRFVYDTGPDRTARVGELLGEIARERENDKKTP
jgi:ribosome-binding factor A